MTIEAIINQHAEEAAFLWLLRDGAVHAPHYYLKDLADLDERVEAHIDGLRIAGHHGWEICAAALKLGEPGEVFAGGVLALESKNDDRLDQVLSVAEVEPETVRGLISALGWVSPKQLQGTVKDLLGSSSLFRRYVGLSACAVHRVSPGEELARSIANGEEALRNRAVRAAGELGRKDLISLLHEKTRSDEANCQFWAAWSSVLLGDRSKALELVKRFATDESPFRARALQLALRVMNTTDARKWLKSLNEKDESLRYVLMGAGITGDPVYVPWLIKHMETPEVARVAGEAFSMITGVDLAYEDLEGEWPEGFEGGPTESPEDEDVAMDPDEDLPWPDPELVNNWWAQNEHGFQAGHRFLIGKPITPEHCHEVLLSGYQRQRNAAAFELALMKPDAPLFETRAPGFRQQALLKARSSGSV